MDRAAEAPDGTTKNYLPTRDAVLRAVAERRLEQHLALTAQPAAGPGPADREGLTALFRTLLENVAGPGRPRLLAHLELQAEAARRPWLAALLGPMASGDSAGFEAAQRSAGPPVTPRRAATVTRAPAIPHPLGAARAHWRRRCWTTWTGSYGGCWTRCTRRTPPRPERAERHSARTTPFRWRDLARTRPRLTRWAVTASGRAARMCPGRTEPVPTL